MVIEHWNEFSGIWGGNEETQESQSSSDDTEKPETKQASYNN